MIDARQVVRGMVGSESYKNFEAVRQHVRQLDKGSILFTGDVSSLNQEIAHMAKQVLGSNLVRIIAANIGNIVGLERVAKTQEADDRLIEALKMHRDAGDDVRLDVFRKGPGSSSMVSKAIFADIPCNTIDESGIVAQAWPPPPKE